MQDVGTLHAHFVEDIRLLDSLFFETLKKHLQPEEFEKIKTFITQTKLIQQDLPEACKKITYIVQQLDEMSLLNAARVFAQHMNLLNIAEQYHRIRRRRWHHAHGNPPQPGSFEAMFSTFKHKKVSNEDILKSIEKIKIDLVLTAHPTEVTRRTMMHKYNEISKGLEKLDQKDLTPMESDSIIDTIHQEITAAWKTEEIRYQKPSALDEARWGFEVVEECLWQAYPEFMRDLDRHFENMNGDKLNLDIVPFRFSSWMGGDRDGNPNVTAEITQHVVLLARRKAASLYWNELKQLQDTLSMNECSQELRNMVGPAHEPYRVLLARVKERLLRTEQWALCHMERREVCPSKDVIFLDPEDLLEPLLVCYRSLKETGADIIADGRLRDLIRRIKSFGLCLLPLDIRQHSEKHQDLMDALLKQKEIGHYNEWSEDQKIEFLTQNIHIAKKYISNINRLNPELQEIAQTFRVLAEQPRDSFGAYVISMAAKPSDILLVLFLQKAFGIRQPLRIVPLFETLEDLNHSPKVLEQIWSLPEYREVFGNFQEVMIGYSDSAKDAGFLAASWAQYRAQEVLTVLSKKYGINLVFFHGMGGSVGRGGGPSHLILSKLPPETMKGEIRITQQGEVIRYRLGIPKIAERTFEIYTNYILENLLFKQSTPTKKWREKMEKLSLVSVEKYQSLLKKPTFLEYFKQATPVNELDKITIGSRPARRKNNGGFKNLRAIPWVFAWTQNRLILPAWFGIGEALSKNMNKAEILDMMHWPYFSSIMALVNMDIMKTSPYISKQYEHHLTEEDLWPLGVSLRHSFDLTKEQLGLIVSSGFSGSSKSNVSSDSYDEYTLRLEQSILLRSVSLLILHMLQIELLKRTRAYAKRVQGDQESERKNRVLERALMVSIAGVASGMQNAG